MTSLEMATYRFEDVGESSSMDWLRPLFAPPPKLLKRGNLDVFWVSITFLRSFAFSTSVLLMSRKPPESEPEGAAASGLGTDSTSSNTLPWDFLRVVKRLRPGFPILRRVLCRGSETVLNAPIGLSGGLRQNHARRSYQAKEEQASVRASVCVWWSASGQLNMCDCRVVWWRLPGAVDEQSRTTVGSLMLQATSIVAGRWQNPISRSR